MNFLNTLVFISILSCTLLSCGGDFGGGDLSPISPETSSDSGATQSPTDEEDSNNKQPEEQPQQEQPQQPEPPPQDDVPGESSPIFSFLQIAPRLSSTAPIEVFPGQEIVVTYSLVNPGRSVMYTLQNISNPNIQLFAFKAGGTADLEIISSTENNQTDTVITDRIIVSPLLRAGEYKLKIISYTLSRNEIEIQLIIKDNQGGPKQGLIKNIVTPPMLYRYDIPGNILDHPVIEIDLSPDVVGYEIDLSPDVAGHPFVQQHLLATYPHLKIGRRPSDGKLIFRVYGVSTPGTHNIEVTAFDEWGNFETIKLSLSVVDATPKQAGPTQIHLLGPNKLSGRGMSGAGIMLCTEFDHTTITLKTTYGERGSNIDWRFKRTRDNRPLTIQVRDSRGPYANRRTYHDKLTTQSPHLSNFRVCLSSTIQDNLKCGDRITLTVEVEDMSLNATQKFIQATKEFIYAERCH